MKKKVKRQTIYGIVLLVVLIIALHIQVEYTHNVLYEVILLICIAVTIISWSKLYYYSRIHDIDNEFEMTRLPQCSYAIKQCEKCGKERFHLFKTYRGVESPPQCLVCALGEEEYERFAEFIEKVLIE